MGAKRAVHGRSQPYDVLLAAYQKKSIGRPNGKEHVPKKKGTTFGPLVKKSRQNISNFYTTSSNSYNLFINFFYYNNSKWS
jgi:hypothetical protein